MLVIHQVECLTEVDEDIVKQQLLKIRKLLAQLSLHGCRSYPSLIEKSVKVVMELNTIELFIYDGLEYLPERFG